MTNEQFTFIDNISHSLLNQFFSDSICEFIACQFALESNYGSSDLAKKYHNIAGMKRPYRRPFYGSNSVNGFASYCDWHECIKDYIVWFVYSHPHANCVSDLQAFKTHLVYSGYCPEKDYIDKIQSIYLQFKSYKHECSKK